MILTTSMLADYWKHSYPLASREQLSDSCDHFGTSQTLPNFKIILTMAQINVVYFLLVAWTVFSFSHSMPYPFYFHEQCSVNELNISDLAGDWHMIYHKDNLTTKVDTQMNLVANRTLLTSIHENGNLVNSFNLTQHDGLPGKLENLVDRGTWTMSIPTFVLSVQPDKYMTLYHSKVDGTDDWAIYSRTNELSEENYTKAIQGLICLRLVDSKSEPLLHKL